MGLKQAYFMPKLEDLTPPGGVLRPLQGGSWDPS